MKDRSNIKLVGNTTTGQNLGTGACVFKDKNNGNNLQFKTISATGNSVQIIETADQIYISGATGGGAGTITGGTNGLSVFEKNIGLGGIFTGATLINASGGKLKYSIHPLFINDTEIVDKKYVDMFVMGLDPKLAVNVATTNNITLSGLTTIDGVLLSTGNRILVKNQISGQINGIYSASTGMWGRTNDFNISGNTTQGSLIPVISGSTNKNSIWVLVTNNPIIPNITPMVFGLFSSSAYNAGNSIRITGGTISVDISTGTLANVLTGATNGLTTVGRNICLGGTLIGDTTIETSISKLTLGTAGQSIVIDPTAVIIGDKTLVANFIYLSSANTNIDSGVGNLNICSNNICVYGSHFNYAIHPTFTGATQIVDVAYVTGKTAGATTYQCSSPSTVTVGGLSAGSPLTGCGLDRILEEILSPYISPSFSSFSNNISSPVEVGTTISGSIPFAWGFSNANVQPATMCVKDVTLGSNLATNICVSSPQSVGICTTTFNTCGQQQSWCGSAKNTNAVQFDSGIYTTTAYLPYYWGVCTCPGPAGACRPVGNAAMVLSGTKVLGDSSGNVTIPFNSGGNDYLWFAIPSSVANKTCWCLNASIYGVIGGAVSAGGNLFPDPNIDVYCNIPVTTACWSGRLYDVYISNKQSTAAILKMGYA